MHFSDTAESLYHPGLQGLHMLLPEADTSNPSPQFWQLVAPGADANVFAAQGKHSNCPSMSWYVPTGQSMHPATFLAPITPPYVPAGQFCGCADTATVVDVCWAEGSQNTPGPQGTQ
jgi:hypothetical protein